MFRHTLSIAALLVGLIGLVATRAPAAERRAVEPARLLFLLDYIGSDYAGAVRDGALANAAEYNEALRFARQILSEYEAGFSRNDETSKALREIVKMIEARAPSDRVAEATRRLAPTMTRSMKADVRLGVEPNLATGARLWANDCATCHGDTGAGDGPAAIWQDPAPPNFQATRRLDQISPRQVFATLTYGIEGTAMPTFVPAYSDKQMWDVAFYLLTRRSGFQPKWVPGVPMPSLDVVASSSNDELLALLRRTAPEANGSAVDYLRAHFPAPALVASNSAPSGLDTALQIQDAFATAAERIFPHVVGIASYEPAGPVPGDGSGNTPGHWVATTDGAPEYGGFRTLATGSGLLLNEDGYVLTHNSLLRNEGGTLAQFVDIELADGLHVIGRVVGSEPKLDLAVVRVADPARLSPPTPALELADSDRLKTGQWVIAAGDPPGPSKVLVPGIVSSGAMRQCYQEQLSATLLQTSLQVPRGGLGGPVVDLFGRVVGLSVNTQVASPLADANRTSTVLPINLAMTLFEALSVAESNRSPWLGISVLELDTRRQQLPVLTRQTLPSSGLYIDNVFDPSPAWQGGVRPGDILVELGGHAIRTVGDFQLWLYVLGIGAPCELKLLRDGTPLTITVSIEARPGAATTS